MKNVYTHKLQSKFDINFPICLSTEITVKKKRKKILRNCLINKTLKRVKQKENLIDFVINHIKKQ